MANKKEIEKEGTLNEIITIKSERPPRFGVRSLRIQQDFEFCPSMAEQHTAHLTDINYLMEKYKPDELSAYIIAKAAHKQAISGYDFSQEPDLQEAKNRVLLLRQTYLNLTPELKNQFPNPLEFYKFLDDPDNVKKLVKMGYIKEKEADKINNDQTMKDKTPPSSSDTPNP